VQLKTHEKSIGHSIVQGEAQLSDIGLLSLHPTMSDEGMRAMMKKLQSLAHELAA
jgi:hypothetical protein